MMNVLFVVSEIFPLIKTGGLGDVAYSLPVELAKADVNIRLLLPAYRSLLEQLPDHTIRAWLDVLGMDGRHHPVRLLEATHEALPFPLWLIDCAALFDRPGNPYLNSDGYNWDDNAERFTVFARAASQIAMNQVNLDWKADVVHCHDWQTGLVPAFLEQEINPPNRIFTIHNMAYGGYFPYDDFRRLNLPPSWWHMDKLEFYGNFSMLKAGLVFSDRITTVSPNYAREICTPEFSYGMEGVLQARQDRLYGILNGIDETVWNPQKDPYLPHQYSAKQIQPSKQQNKQALLNYFAAPNLKEKLNQPLLGSIGRLVEQKGIDLLITLVPKIMTETTANVVIVGSGQSYYEYQIRQLHEQYPQRVFIHIGYNEELAHLLESGSDIFLMPSRFEPCGLNQMYSQRYGTVPIVNNTGGLADTVTDTNAQTLNAQTATGFVMKHLSSDELYHQLQKAINLFQKPTIWQQLQSTAMQQSFSWKRSADQYITLYQTKEA